MLPLKGLNILRSFQGWGVSRRHAVAEALGGKPAGEEGAVASLLGTQLCLGCQLAPGLLAACPLPPHSRTRTWCSGWSLSSWSWSARAMSSSSPTRLSCAASWPTSWIRAQVPLREGLGGDWTRGWHQDPWQLDLPPLSLKLEYILQAPVRGAQQPPSQLFAELIAGPKAPSGGAAAGAAQSCLARGQPRANPSGSIRKAVEHCQLVTLATRRVVP